MIIGGVSYLTSYVCYCIPYESGIIVSTNLLRIICIIVCLRIIIVIIVIIITTNIVEVINFDMLFA